MGTWHGFEATCDYVVRRNLSAVQEYDGVKGRLDCRRSVKRSRTTLEMSPSRASRFNGHYGRRLLRPDHGRRLWSIMALSHRCRRGLTSYRNFHGVPCPQFRRPPRRLMRNRMQTPVPGGVVRYRIGPAGGSSRKRHIKMPSTYSSSSGNIISIMLHGSGDVVRTMEAIEMIKTAIRQFSL